MSNTIAVTNWQNTTLSFKNPKARGGTAPPTANVSSIALGATMTVTVTTALLYAGQGSFQLSGAGVTFTIAYTLLPQGGLALEVPSQTSGYVGLVGQQVYKAGLGVPVAATVDLYQGNQSGTQQPYGYAAPLDTRTPGQVNNRADLANSLYGKNMRQFSLVSAQFDQPSVLKPPMLPADFTGGQMSTPFGVVSTLSAAMAKNIGNDGKILRFLANYLVPESGPGMNMWIPDLRWSGTSASGLPIYALGGYTCFPLADGFVGPNRWRKAAPNLKLFLTLLASGAHFVAISATADFANQNVASTGASSLLEAFANSGLPQSTDPGNSHYTTTLNVSGKYFLDIDEDWAPPGSGLILALLFGSTVNALYRSLPSGGYNTFLQLEGWQSSLPHSSRHGADYSAHTKSLWNFSTFGACPYSEKRGATIFLAPSQWLPRIYSNTFMMPYVGAYPVTTYTGNPPVPISGPVPPAWFDSAVVSVPADTYTAPSQYNVNVYED